MNATRDPTETTLRALVEDIERQAGDALVGVGYHSGRDWDALYMREDFVEKHGPERREQIANDTILRGLEKQPLETIWNFGELQYTMAAYEEALVLHVPFTETRGLAVGLDPVGGETVDAIVDAALAYRDEFREE